MASKWTFLVSFLLCTTLCWILLHRETVRVFSSRFGNPAKTREILFFFRVPKTGSEMTVLLLRWLQGVNNFRHIRLQNTVHRRLDSIDQVNSCIILWQDVCVSCHEHLSFRQSSLYACLTRLFCNDFQFKLRQEILDDLSASEGLPVAFDRHVYFTDLERLYQRTSQVVKVNYFSSLRDPIDRIVSQFYYARATPRQDLRLPLHLKTPPPKFCRFSKVAQEYSFP